jgi:hypothetical protein
MYTDGTRNIQNILVSDFKSIIMLGILIVNLFSVASLYYLESCCPAKSFCS